MPMPRTGIVKDLWLHLLREGGHSTVAEMSDAFNVKRDRIDSVITNMAARGYCQRFRSSSRKNGVGYGVTVACKVPHQVELKEVLAAAGAFPASTT